MKAWKATTGYCQTGYYQGHEIKTQSWMIECGDLQVTVTCNPFYCRPGQWCVESLSCGLSLRPLNIPGDSSAETAQDAALNLVRRRLRTLQDDYQSMVNLMKEGDDKSVPFPTPTTED